LSLIRFSPTGLSSPWGGLPFFEEDPIMGWFHTQRATKRAIIQDCIAERDSRVAHETTLAHCVRGNVLWTVHERLDKPTGQRRRFIGCYLLRSNPGFGWGYKPLDESMGPAVASCPLAYLKLAPTANPAWRTKVLTYHARQRRRFTVGDKVTLIGATVPPWVVIRSLRPLTGTYAGCTYHLPRQMLGEVLQSA
jgi:hypothetical protein